MTKYRAISPFLCMDMTYITCLLKEGFGFKDSTVLQVSRISQELSFHFKHCGGGTFSLCMVVTEILLLFRPTADQEGEQRGDELGPRGHF